MQLLQKKEEKERGESHYTKRLNKSKSNKSYKFKVVAYTTEHLPLPSSRYAALPQPLGVRGFRRKVLVGHSCYRRGIALLARGHPSLCLGKAQWCCWGVFILLTSGMFGTHIRFLTCSCTLLLLHRCAALCNGCVCCVGSVSCVSQTVHCFLPHP